MSSTSSNQIFENLTHSGIIKITSKESKEVSFQLDVWNGRTSFVIFTGTGGRPWKYSMNRNAINLIKAILTKLRDNIRPGRQAVMLNGWNAETKKTVEEGQIGFGFDDKLNFGIDVAHKDLQGRHIFLLRPTFNFDLSQTFLTEEDKARAMVDYFLEALSLETLVAERISNFKIDRQKSSGNRGGGGYRTSGQSGGSSYGGGDNQSRGGSFSDVSDNDLQF